MFIESVRVHHFATSAVHVASRVEVFGHSDDDFEELVSTECISRDVHVDVLFVGSTCCDDLREDDIEVRDLIVLVIEESKVSNEVLPESEDVNEWVLSRA